jgi:anti-sigma B factor antagonist
VNGRHFNVSLTEQADGAVLRVSGEVDIVTAPVLHRHLESVVAASRPVVVIDLSETTFLDARGVGVIVAARKQVGAYGGRLVLRRPPPVVRRVLELADQLDRLEVEP